MLGIRNTNLTSLSLPFSLSTYLLSSLPPSFFLVIMRSWCNLGLDVISPMLYLSISWKSATHTTLNPNSGSGYEESSERKTKAGNKITTKNIVAEKVNNSITGKYDNCLNINLWFPNLFFIIWKYLSFGCKLLAYYSKNDDLNVPQKHGLEMFHWFF